jgi:hypothetical protein
MSGKTHLIIPDSHAHPDFHNKRYSYLGHLIRDIRPDVVVDIGDFFDMPSLCSYDKGKKSFEGRRYKDDIEAGLDAQERIYGITRSAKKKLPRFVRCLGNHEHRISRAIELDPVLEGTIGLSDLQSREYGWEQHDFNTPVSVDGVLYSHYFVSGVAGRACPSAANLLAKNLSSCTMGHNHTFDYKTANTADGRRLHSLFCGVYQDYDSDYAGQANEIWDRGVVIKRNVEAGNYDLEWVSLKRIEEAYRDYVKH